MEGFLTWCLSLLSDCFVWWQVVWQLLQWVRVHTFNSVYCSWHCAFTSSHSTHIVFAHQLAVSCDRVWVPCSSLKRSWLLWCFIKRDIELYHSVNVRLWETCLQLLMGCCSAKSEGTNSLMFLLRYSVGAQCFFAFRISIAKWHARTGKFWNSMVSWWSWVLLEKL